MKIASIREKIRQASYFIPVRIHLLLLVTALFLAAAWIQKNNAVPETSRTAIINLFLAVTFWFALCILIFSFLSAIIPWILFLFSKKYKRSALILKTPDKRIINQQQVFINISRIARPLFGYIRLRLVYDKDNISPKFTPLSSTTKKHFFSMDLKGLFNWPLKNIKEYDIRSSIIYFEDFFQFFSFTTQIPSKGNFYTQPPETETRTLSVQPKKTEQTNMRIEEMRKVEGEFLNYKNFEHNDDVRRIVWKIYAKNKELVVRIPETNDPYASHIYFYASFYNAISSDVYEEFNALFLDNYKTVIWNVYEQLYRRHALIDYVPDQQAKKYYIDNPLQSVKYIISTSSWQKEKDIVTYFNKQYGSVLCISSLTDVKQLEEILDKSGKTLNIIFVQLSKCFANVQVTDWLQWIFVNPGKKTTEKLQLTFNVSPLRRKILENEKLINNILNKSECEILVIEN